MARAAIIGLTGTTLDSAERVLLARLPPAGVILFARNVRDPAQVADLTAALRAAHPRLLVMIDQEGGRVARLRPPHWRAHPPTAAIGALYARDPAAGLRAAFLTGALIGAACAKLGIDMVTAPVLDVVVPGAHDIIGDRAFGGDAGAVAALGAAMAGGLGQAGVMPVMKHIPGHGRATADSHETLPVLAKGSETDLVPFAANAALPAAMTAHVVYADWDPALPATLSSTVIGRIVRLRCRFGGLLVSDDLSMKALEGPAAARAIGALGAGCDLALYCPPEDPAREAVLAACPEVAGAVAARIDAARAWVARAKATMPLDEAALAAERAALMPDDA